jgi:epoxyqueuosine reductase
LIASSDIKTRARELGFDGCGIAPVGDHPELKFFTDWLARGRAASMAYLSRTAESRADVRRVLPSARSVIMTATIYNTRRPYSTEIADPSRAKIARYAWGDDYHDVLRERLDALLGWMREHASKSFDARAYVDTGPIQERIYAQYAGIGWIGKNTCLISPEMGSWVLLGEIVCSLALDCDQPVFDHCGECTLCLEACPTSALVAPGELDSRRCISYLTIEHRGEIPEPLQRAIGSHVYGCDICQEVCPWNQTAPVSTDTAWQPRPEWDVPAIADLVRMTDDELRRALRGSPMKRAKIDGLRRNFALASANADAPREAALAEMRDGEAKA